MDAVARRVAAVAVTTLLCSGALACGSSSSSSDDGAAPGATTPAIGFEAPPTFDPSGPVIHLRVETLASHPHDDSAYTQGLVYAGPDRLYETTGRYGHSSLRETSIATGDVRRESALDDTYFGEGLALSDGRLIALTWKEQTALAFDPATFDRTATYSYDTEGWGLCDDGSRLVMSDGSSTLTFRDQQSFEAIGSVQVTMDGAPTAALNELECVDGLIYANVYTTDQIVVIEPGSGQVVGDIDARGLLGAEASAGLEPGEVLNGIAYDPDRGVFYLTGKHWPTLFEVRFVPV